MGNSASTLPYSIGKQVCSLENGWSLHEGQQKSDGRTVSVFVGKKPSMAKTPVNRRVAPELTQLRPALHHFSVCRKLRHPHILTVHATLDTDDPAESSGASGAEYRNAQSSSSTSSKNSNPQTTGDLIVVTESCVPFRAWLKETSPTPEVRAWGLEAACRALHFLHASAGLAHGRVCPDALFVDRAGDVKLFDFCLTTSVVANGGGGGGGLDADFVDYEGLLTPERYRSPERQQRQWDALTSSSATHAMDSYAFGALIHDVYEGHVPGPLQKATQRLQTANVKMRPRLQPLLRCPVFDTPYQKLQLQLEEFAVQPVEQKIGFWKNLTPSLRAGLVPSPLAAYRIFPMMVASLRTICTADSIRTQDLYRREVLAMLVPLFYIAENYLGQDFTREMGPLVTLLFTINDRGVRGSLLKKAAVLAKHLDNNSLNVNVFEPMCSGFSDSSAALRELTLKATAVLMPHLTQPNLEKLSRYLVRLQSDTEDKIRQQVVSFFAKLAPHLSEVTRSKLLLPALTRGMKDPMSSCRLAALDATLSVKQQFSPAGIASQVVPAVSPCLVDPAAAVRKSAFSIMEDLLFVLRQESERLSRLPEAPEQGTSSSAPASGGVPVPPVSAPAPPVPAPAAAPPASSSSTNYFSSWMTPSPSAAAPAATPAPPAQQQQPAAARVAAPPAMTSANAMTNTSIPPGSSSNNNNHHLDNWDDEDDGWGDEDILGEDDDDLAMSNIAAPPVSAPLPGNNTAPQPRGKLKIPGAKTAGVPTAKPSVKKLSLNDSLTDGWDDF